MAKESILVNYDRDEDIISLLREGSNVKFSFDISLPNGDLVIDYGFDGRIIGIEFFNASKYFPSLNQVSDVNKIKGAMSVKYGPNWAQIHYILYLPNVSQPIQSFIAAPYNKQLILEH